MILKIQNFCEKRCSIDLHISRQNPSIETTTSGKNENLDKKFLLILYIIIIINRSFYLNSHFSQKWWVEKDLFFTEMLNF